MARRFTLVTVVLIGCIGLLVGAIVAGGFARPRVVAQTSEPTMAAVPADSRRLRASEPASMSAPLASFADVVERINPAVVNISATSSGGTGDARRRRPLVLPDPPELFQSPRSDAPRRGTGSGFIISPDGSILTNHHVIDGAERILVTLSDGRALRARVVGTDPDTDIALLKIDGETQLPVAKMGDSSALRMGEWVCAIGNPLGYDHSVTVGVVSYLGRKLFDASLDDYIQTDAAINFGNSGGPLINMRGEVIGINAAISARASNIGFAVPINGATAILPQLRAHGRVSRGYLGVVPRTLDADLQRSLHITTPAGAVVQDVTEGSPAERAGIRPYDIVVRVDDVVVTTEDEFVHAVAARAPGTPTEIRLVRDGREIVVTARLSERPSRETVDRPPVRSGGATLVDGPSLLGLTVRDLDAGVFNRLRLPKSIRGVLIARIDGMSALVDANVQRGTILLEMNRKPIVSVADYNRLATAVQPGDVLTLYVYAPDVGQRQLKTVRLYER
jgi:serine protease Do